MPLPEQLQTIDLSFSVLSY